MRRLILGCGYLGRRVARLWISAGHEVVALTRSPEHAETLRGAGIVPALGDVTDVESLRRLPEVETALWAVGFDRASGHSQRTVYVDGLENAVHALSGRVGRWIVVSSTSVYGQTDGSWVDERSDCVPNKPNGQVCHDAEHAFRRLLESQPEVGGHVLRLAGLYGPKRLLQRLAGLQAGTPLTGNPEAWLNLIHVDDAARSVLACERSTERRATWLGVDDRPIRRREYYGLLARLAGAPEPVYEASAADSTELSDFNKRCSNRALRRQLGVELAYPTIEAGLPQALSSDETL